MQWRHRDRDVLPERELRRLAQSTQVTRQQPGHGARENVVYEDPHRNTKLCSKNSSVAGLFKALNSLTRARNGCPTFNRDSGVNF